MVPEKLPRLLSIIVAEALVPATKIRLAGLDESPKSTTFSTIIAECERAPDVALTVTK
jgi:hypothetical protein